ADRLGMTWLDAEWVHEHGTRETLAAIKRIIGTRKAYLTFDIDCLDPSCAPGTGTPVVGGLTIQQARALLRGLAGCDFVAMDLVAVARRYATAEVPALAGPTLMLDYLCLRARDLPVKVARQ